MSVLDPGPGVAEAPDAPAVDVHCLHLNGEVRVELFKGHATVVGRRSEHSALYSYEMATYDEGDQFDQTLAEGFVKLWGLPLKTWAERARSLGDAI